MLRPQCSFVLEVVLKYVELLPRADARRLLWRLTKGYTHIESNAVGRLITLRPDIVGEREIERTFHLWVVSCREQGNPDPATRDAIGALADRLSRKQIGVIEKVVKQGCCEQARDLLRRLHMLGKYP